MTGFEAWVKMGLELGGKEILDVVAEIDAEQEGCLITPTNELAAEVAKRLMKRWPPWKVENTKQADILFDCELCGFGVPMKDTRTTAHGRVCIACLDSMVKGMLP